MDTAQPVSTLELLKKQHAMGLRILEKAILNKTDVFNLFVRVHRALKNLYGENTPIEKRNREKRIAINRNGITKEHLQKELEELNAFIAHLEFQSGAQHIHTVSAPNPPPATNKVFIIHGHDELNTHRLTLLLQNHFHLEPEIIRAQPGKSRPLIDKFEDSANGCTFAFALFTPDDEILLKDGNYKQARPNVIFELGWFVGRLGRHRAVILLKEGAKVYTDIHGVSYIPFKESIEEKVLDIQQELMAADLIKN